MEWGLNTLGHTRSERIPILKRSIWKATGEKNESQ